MYWQKRFDRENPDKYLEEEISKIHAENKDYGYRRVYRELRNRKLFVNKKKVQRILQKLGYQVTSFTRKSRRYNSYKGNVGKIAPNRINRRFNTSVPHQKITTDTTEFKYYEIDNKGRMVIKKLYLDPFLDMFNGTGQCLFFVFECCLAHAVDALVGVDLDEDPVGAEAVDRKAFYVCNLHFCSPFNFLFFQLSNLVRKKEFSISILILDQ